jgi:hypothetical protein
MKIRGIFPNPDFYKSWQLWAAALLRLLESQHAYESLEGYTVAQLPSAALPRRFIIVLNEIGGEVPAFNDGTNWRRVTDRAIVS